MANQLALDPDSLKLDTTGILKAGKSCHFMPLAMSPSEVTESPHSRKKLSAVLVVGGKPRRGISVRPGMQGSMIIVVVCNKSINEEEPAQET